jgi:release factor glutamine methyltransferase
MTVKSALDSAVDRLAAAGVGSPRMNAELLLRFVLGCDRAYLFAHPERELTDKEQARYAEVIERRATGVPAQYITGHQEFWGLDFIVTPAVLIPRPETEHLIETVLSILQNSSGPSRRIVDVGTGSGCIAVALAKELSGAEIDAVDNSSAALEIARANAARHQLDTRITFRQGDLLNGFPSSHFDLVVSNPPYVGESESDQVQLEVRKFEPRSAVFAGHTGLEIIARLVPQASEALKPGGWLVMEVSGTIVEGTQQLLREWNEVKVVNDLQAIPRVVAARKPL